MSKYIKVAQKENVEILTPKKVFEPVVINPFATLDKLLISDIFNLTCQSYC